jgi:hypothetical protein
MPKVNLGKYKDHPAVEAEKSEITVLDPQLPVETTTQQNSTQEPKNPSKKGKGNKPKTQSPEDSIPIEMKRKLKSLCRAVYKQYKPSKKNGPRSPMRLNTIEIYNFFHLDELPDPEIIEFENENRDEK